MRRHWLSLAALAWVALCLVTALPGPGVGVARADAGFERLTLDRIELEPSTVNGLARLRLYVSAVQLLRGGDVIAVPPKGWRLKVGSSDRKMPYATGLFAGAESDAAVVFLFETAGELREALPAARKAIVESVLPALPPDTLIGVAGYGVDAPTSIKLAPLKTAQGRFDDLQLSAPGTPDLVTAVDAAIRALRNLKTNPPGRPLRRMIVLVSDGRTREPDRDVITDLGTRAGRAGIRIQSLAFAPAELSKGTLLNLGELSKQSMGTLRWVRLAGDQAWKTAAEKLRDEIARQYVLTFLVAGEDFAGKQVTVSADLGGGKVMGSNRLRTPRLLCGREECPGDGYCVDSVCVVRRTEGGLGFFGWLLTILGVLAGLAAVGGAGYVVVQKLRAGRGAPPAGVPVAPPAQPPGVIAPIVPGGHRPGAAGGYPATGGHAAAPPVAHRPAPAQPVLYIMSGPRTGQRVALHHGFLIGKAPGCHLVLDHDGFASSQHASIDMDAAGTCTLVDRGSTNGTFVNGVRVSTVVLTHGTAVRVGSTELRFLSQ